MVRWANWDIVPFNEPSDAIVRVLLKIGADPAERLSPRDQDPEYTACRSEELPAYFELYLHGALDASERAVLCCFLLEGLNDFCSGGVPHPLQTAIFCALFDAGQLHANELAYWTDTSDSDPNNWWPITKHLLAYRASRSRSAGAAET